MEFTDGVDYIPEDSAKNTSSVAKYVTKEINLKTPASAVDVIITANVTNSENIKSLYKTKTASVQKNLKILNGYCSTELVMLINQNLLLHRILSLLRRKSNLPIKSLDLVLTT